MQVHIITPNELAVVQTESFYLGLMGAISTIWSSGAVSLQTIDLCKDILKKNKVKLQELYNLVSEDNKKILKEMYPREFENEKV